MKKFSISNEQLKKLHEWQEKVNQIAIEQQKLEHAGDPQYEADWKEGYPYGGAIGGATTYSFTPTSIGVIVKVTDAHTKQVIDLTEYDLW